MLNNILDMLDNDPSLNNFNFNEFKEYVKNMEEWIDDFQKEIDNKLQDDEN